MDLPLDQILLGDCLDLLRTLPDESIDSLVSDVPYGLGSKEPSPEDLFMYVLGGSLDTKGDFMGKDWEIPSVAVWKEVYRVLKPGGHVLSFAGARTSDLIGMGLRLAGFESRDSITRLYPTLVWAYGCLTPEVEILTPQGWKTQESLSTGDTLLTFEPTTSSYAWGQISKIHRHDHSGPMVHVQAAEGSYDVTPDHTVYALSNGTWLASRADTLRVAEVPAVEDLRGLLDELRNPELEGGAQENLFEKVLEHTDLPKKDGVTQGPGPLQRQNPSGLHGVQDALLHVPGLVEENQGTPLLTALQRNSPRTGVGETRTQGPGGLDRRVSDQLSNEDDRSWEPRLEGGSNIPLVARELRPRALREMPNSTSADGAEGWVYLRAPASSGDVSGTSVGALGGRASCRSRLQEQQVGEPHVVPQPERPQEIRGPRYTRADLAGFTRGFYRGLVWCVTVPTGAFVARRKGYVFITGNSGMPKSHNISKGIDKKLGKKRKVVGKQRGRGGENLNTLSRPGKGDADDAKGMGAYGVGAKQVDVEVDVTLPASAEATQWEGWGSGLKPAAEPILVFRKPLRGTLAQNVLTYGTGGLNIDATRVRHASKEDFEAHKAQVDAVREKGGVRGNSWKNESDLSGANEVKEGGRWPANLVLEHSASCRKVGTQTIAPHPQGPDRFQQTTGGDFSDAYGNQLASDEPEVMPVWECAEGCPVHAMDAQSGDRPSTLTGRADPNGSHEHPGTTMNPNSTFLGERTHLSKVYADAGGASRFFTQIEGEGGETRNGRWPSNLVLTHAEGCKQIGTKRARGTHSAVAKGESIEGKTWRTRNKYAYGACDMDRPVMSHVGPDGLEEIAAWECIEGCPVKAMDEQSGTLRSGKDVNPTEGPVQGFFGQTMGYYSKDANYGDEGGASRFFTQVQEGVGEGDPSKGRWPANLVLTHAAGCVSKGTQKIKRRSGDVTGNEPSASTQGAYGKYAKRASSKLGDDEGFETVEAWECVEGCPVKAMDEQSGNCPGMPLTTQRRGESNRDSYSGGWGPDPAASGSTGYGDEGGASRFFTQVQEGEGDTSKGRWPANLVLTHAEGCVSKGYIKARAPKGGAGILWSHIRDGKKDDAKPSTSQLGDEQGEELVEAWDCVEGCPVKELAAQGVKTGSHVAGNKGETNHTIGNKVYGDFAPMTNNPDYHADEGGVDRFFSQFEAEGGSPFRYIPKANRREAGCGEFEVQHITIKPLELMRWLVRLVTPKGGIVLDPYCGSGSTCHAAVVEGMHFIGFERHAASYEEAKRRLDIVLGREREKKTAEDIFDFAMGGT